MKMTLYFIRLYFRILSYLGPSKAGEKAFWMFQKTRKLPFKKVETEFYHTARKFQVAHPKENVNVYEVGNPDGKLVILVHGWESNAGSMGAIANRLSLEGFRVIALDLPAHGQSMLTHTNLRECIEALRAVIYQLRPKESFSVVSHSFGSAVSAFALADSRYKIDNFVMLTSPNKLLHIFEEYKNIIGLGDYAFEYLLSRADLILNEPVRALSVEGKLKKVSFKNLSLIHDNNDKVLPFSNSLDIHHGVSSTLIPFKNVGHYRMLWNNEVIDSILYELRKLEEEVEVNYKELANAF